MTLSPAMLWLALIIVGIGTFAFRASGILFLGKKKYPLFLERAMHYVPSAVLAAIISSSLLVKDSHNSDPDNHRLLAALLAFLVAYKTKSLFWTIATGMVALWALNGMSRW